MKKKKKEKKLSRKTHNKFFLRKNKRSGTKHFQKFYHRLIWGEGIVFGGGGYFLSCIVNVLIGITNCLCPGMF